MNVLHIVTWYSDYRAEKIIEGCFHNELAKALDEKCNNAIWFPIDSSINVRMTQNREWNVLTYRSRPQKNKFLQIHELIKIFMEINKEFQVDLIHAHVARIAGVAGVILGKIFNLPVIVTEHAPVQMMGLDQLSNRIILEMVYKMSNQNVCVSIDLTHKLKKIFPKEHFITILNGVKDPQFILSQKEEKVNYRKKDYVNAVIVANFYDRDIKGFQYLLPAVQIVNQYCDKKVFLHICGDGKYLEYYKKMAENLEISQFCCFYGNCEKDKMYEVISQADFGISSSLFESAGISIEEMLLLGKPMVVTNSGGGNSLVNDKCAIIVEKGSVDELVNGMKKMSITFINYDNKLIRNAALQKYEMNSIVNQYINLYNQYIYI